MFKRSTFYNPKNKVARTIGFLLFILLLSAVSFSNIYSQARIGSTDYSTLKGAFDAINAGTHTGDITITIRSSLTETSAAVLQASGVGSANYSSITIYPTGTYTISGSIVNGLIELRGADNVTIDGRANQSGTTNSLTLQNTYTSTSTVIWLDSNTASTVANGAKNNTIRNCNITGANTTSSWGITCGSSASLSTGGVGMDNNKFINNVITNCYYGFRIYGTSTATTGKNRKCELSNNVMSGSIMVYAMYLYYAEDLIVNENRIDGHSGSSTLYCILNYYSPRAKIYDNSYTNISTSSTIYGIYNYYSEYSDIYNNTFDNIVSSGTIYVLYNYYSFKSNTYDNVFQNVTSTGGTIYGMYHYYCDTSKVYRNTIANITASTTMYGIYSYSGLTLYERNLIYSLKSTSTGGYAAVGIYMAGASSGIPGNYDTLRNNVIYKMTSTNYSASSLVYNPFGILIASGIGHRIWHNSINLYGQQEGSNTQGTLSAAFGVSSTAVNSLDVRNNVFSNSLVGLTGSQSYAIYLSGTANLTSSTFNYNDYFASGTYGVLGYLSGNRTDITAWRSATSQDVNSFSSNPNYNANDFLIPLPGSPLVSAGTPLSQVPRDYLNDARSTTAPTVGAYEQSGEFAPPAATFTPLANTTSTSNRVLNNFAQITDNSGVNTTTYAPRLYYKKSTDNNTYTGNTSANNGWKYVVGTNTGNMFSFTIDYSKLQGGSVQSNDLIQYFIVAQDLVSPPNVGIYSGKFSSKPSNLDLTSSAFPITGSILSYRISPSISGTVRVGSAETYKSLSNSDGLFAYMNGAVLTGNVTILITSSITNETGAVGLREIAAEGGNPYTITIRPNAATNYTISGSSSTSLIRLEGADRVTIDGSFNNAGRFLTFVNTNTAGNIATLHVASFTGGANSNTIKNCNVSTGSNTSTNFGIYVADNAISTSGAGNDNDNLTIDNNVVTKAYYGIYVSGNAGVRTDNLIISNNIIGSNTAADYINLRGILIQNVDYAHVRGNEVFNLRVAPSTNVAGIEIGGTNNYCEIYRNKVYAIKNPSSGGWGAWGINVLTTTSNYMKIYNNFIWDITTMNYSPSTTFYNPFGIRLTGGTNYSIYHNTVHMYGTQDNVGSSGSLTACFLVTTTSVTGMDLRNNIFANGLSSNIAGTKSYTVYVASGSPSGQFNNMDYNIHYAYGTYGILAGYNTTPTDISDLTGLRSFYGRNTNTKVRTVSFIANNDLHLDGSAVGHSDFYAPALGITNDMDLENRRTTNCYVGADEINSIIGIKTNTTATPDLPVYCANTSSLVINFEPEVKGFVDGIKRSVTPTFTYDWYKNNQRFDTRTSLSFVPLTQADSATYYAIATFDGSQVQSDPKHIKVETAMSVTKHPNSVEVCSNDPSLTLQGGGAGTIIGYQWQKERKNTPGTFDDIVGQNSPNLQLTLTNPLDAAGAYRLKIIGPGNCGPANVFTNLAYVIVSDPITWTQQQTSKNIASVCVGERFDIGVTSDGTVLGYMWQRLETGSWKDLSLTKYPTATSRTLVFPAADPSESGDYRCIVFGSPYCIPSQAVSETFTIKIFPEATFTFQPESQQVCENENVVLIAYTDARTFSYQWQKDGKDLTVDLFPSAKSPILYLNNLNFASSGVYSCIINVEDCKGIRNINSNEALIYVHSKTEIVSKPATAYYPLGDVAQFEVKAHVELIDNMNYEIQWWRGNIKIRDNDRVAGSNSSILSIRDLQPSDYGNDYWVMVTGLCGVDSMKFMTLETPDIRVLNNPANVVSCEYKDISFSVDALAFGGTNITYQWFRGSNPLSDGEKYNGAKTRTLVIKNVTIEDEGDDYFVRITLHPYNITINSDNVSLDIKQNLFYLTQLPESHSVKVGEELRLVFEVVGEEPITYQWFKNGNLLPNFTENTLVIANSAFVDAGVYKCIATNECGTLTSKECTVAITTFFIMSTEDDHSSLEFGNTPNPTSGATTIFFNSDEVAFAKIVLRDVMGREIKTLFDGVSKAGYNEVRFNPMELNLSSGLYYYSITIGEKSATKSMIIVK